MKNAPKPAPPNRHERRGTEKEMTKGLPTPTPEQIEKSPAQVISELQTKLKNVTRVAEYYKGARDQFEQNLVIVQGELSDLQQQHQMLVQEAGELRKQLDGDEEQGDPLDGEPAPGTTEKDAHPDARPEEEEIDG